jgi:hypothetical protein
MTESNERKIRVYIAGPMTDGGRCVDPSAVSHRVQVFHDAAAKLRAEGYDVVNPAEIPDTDPPRSWKEWMASGITQLVTCDAIYLLPYWHESRGAVTEWHIAHFLGMDVWQAYE